AARLVRHARGPHDPAARHGVAPGAELGPRGPRRRVRRSRSVDLPPARRARAARRRDLRPGGAGRRPVVVARVRAWLLRRRLERPAAGEPGSAERTYGIWGPIVLFVLLTGLGIALLVVLGTSPSGGSVLVGAPQPLPER